MGAGCGTVPSSALLVLFLGERVLTEAFRTKVTQRLENSVFLQSQTGDLNARDAVANISVNRRSNLTPDRRPILTPLNGGF